MRTLVLVLVLAVASTLLIGLASGGTHAETGAVALKMADPTTQVALKMGEPDLGLKMGEDGIAA